MRSRSNRHSSTCQGASSASGQSGGPALQHVGTVHGVAVEEVGDVPDAREALRALHRRRVPHVLRQGCEPGFVEVLLHHLDQRPDRSLGEPGVARGIGTRRQRQRPADERAGEGKVDVGAHAVLPALAGPQVRGQALGQPPLDAARGHRHHLGCHGVLERLRDQLGPASTPARRPAQIGGRGAPAAEYVAGVRAPQTAVWRCGAADAPSLELGRVGSASGRGARGGPAFGQGEDVLTPRLAGSLVVVHLDRLQMPRCRVDR